MLTSLNSYRFLQKKGPNGIFLPSKAWIEISGCLSRETQTLEKGTTVAIFFFFGSSACLFVKIP